MCVDKAYDNTVIPAMRYMKSVCVHVMNKAYCYKWCMYENIWVCMNRACWHEAMHAHAYLCVRGLGVSSLQLLLGDACMCGGVFMKEVYVLHFALPLVLEPPASIHIFECVWMNKESLAVWIRCAVVFCTNMVYAHSHFCESVHVYVRARVHISNTCPHSFMQINACILHGQGLC